MADGFIVVIEGLEHLHSFEEIPRKIVEAARIAINDTAVSARTMYGRAIMEETAFPDSYVAPRNGRLVVSDRATNSKLEATITARSRATSLARFALENGPSGGKRGRRKPGVRVEVEPHTVKKLDGAFLIKLKQGSASIDTKSNLGLAVRTRNGKPPPGYKPVPIGKNLWLLYGPSVAQNLYSAKNRGGVATDLAPEIANELEAEFWRQMDRLDA